LQRLRVLTHDGPLALLIPTPLSASVRSQAGHGIDSMFGDGCRKLEDICVLDPPPKPLAYSLPVVKPHLQPGYSQKHHPDPSFSSASGRRR
jgi:hypothetical protein